MPKTLMAKIEACKFLGLELLFPWRMHLASLKNGGMGTVNTTDIQT